MVLVINVIYSFPGGLMLERQVIVNHFEGLHARPAADVMKLAVRFKSKIMMVYGNRTANAKSMLSMMKLGVKQGKEVLIRADGPDAEEALTVISCFLEDAV
jgi:phosphotransferase system HPr (HPr) family protein